MFLVLPITAEVIAKAGHSGMANRYVMPTILGGALCLGYLIDRMSRHTGVLLFGLFLTGYALSSVHIVQELLRGSLFGRRSAAAREVEGIVAQFDESDLPIVVSSGLRYLPMAYYTRADLTRRLYVIADPQAALRLSDRRTDSLDLALLALRRYFPLQVENYKDFVSSHREFLLIVGPGDSGLGGGAGFDWLPARLLEDGDTLRLVSPPGATTVYKVTVIP
jgi:hypothetical protein